MAVGGTCLVEGCKRPHMYNSQVCYVHKGMNTKPTVEFLSKSSDTHIAASSLQQSIEEPLNMFKCPFCPKVFAAHHHLQQHSMDLHGKKIRPRANNTTKQKSNTSLWDIIGFIFDVFGLVLGIMAGAYRENAGAQNSTGAQNSNFYSGTTYRCINGHQITSTTIPRKCPFCGAGMF